MNPQSRFASSAPRFSAFVVAALALLVPVPARALPKCFKIRFIPGNGVVQDVATGLTWARAIGPVSYTGDGAIEYCKNYSLAPGGWRVPTVAELVSLLDLEKSVPGPLIDSAIFANTPSDRFWTSTAYPGSVFLSYVDFGRGETGQQVRYDTNSLYYVRCVRGPTQ